MSKFLSLSKGLVVCALALALAGCAGVVVGVEPSAQIDVPVRNEAPFSASDDGLDARDRELANAALSEAPADARLIALNEDVPPVGPAARSGCDDGLDARDRELANTALSEAPADARLIALNEDVPPVGPAARSGRDDGMDARDRAQSLLAAPNGVRP